MSAYFNRFDICEAYATFEKDFNVGGWLPERPGNRRRRREATHVQLHRMQFRVSPLGGEFRHLTRNGRVIYLQLRRRYGFNRK